MMQSKPIESPSEPILSSTTNNSKQSNKMKFMIISMVAILSFALLSFLLYLALSSASRRHGPSTDTGLSEHDIIYQACKASRDPSACEASLSQSNYVQPGDTILKAVESAVWVSSRDLNTGQRMVKDILDESVGNKNRSDIAKICLEILRLSEYRMNLTGDALPHGKIKDGRAWVSAALAYEYGCWSGLKRVNDISLVDKTVLFFNSSLIVSSSNALAMMANYDAYGDKTASWGPPKTERDGFWEPASGSSISKPTGSLLSGLKADVTVCKGGCDYLTVQEAVNAAPDNLGSSKRFVIWIKTGVYEETVRIPLEKRNVVFLGDGMGKTIITGSLNVGQHGVSTYDSATVGVLGDGFMATGVTIQNTAGHGAYQAVAFRSDSDLSILENCELIGNQDTVYAHSLRQYYKSCRILGNIDFIFGQSAAFFQDCLILVVPRQLNPEKGEDNPVTAHGRIDPGQSTGFVFENCVINGTDAYMALYHSKPSVHKNYLGRPWKEYSRTVFIHCTLEALIIPEGWMIWSGDFALTTLYYGEFGNTGPGSSTSKRVNWSSQIPAEHISSYSLQSFIQGDQWIPTSS